jgi:hypothetical protein
MHALEMYENLLYFRDQPLPKFLREKSEIVRNYIRNYVKKKLT